MPHADEKEDDDDHVSLCSSTSSITDEAMWRSAEIEEWNLGNQLPALGSDAEESDAEERAALPTDSESEDDEEEKQQLEIALQSGAGIAVTKKDDGFAEACGKPDDEDDTPSLASSSCEDVQGDGANPQDHGDFVNSKVRSERNSVSFSVLANGGDSQPHEGGAASSSGGAASSSVRFASQPSSDAIAAPVQPGGDVVLDLSRSRPGSAKGSKVSAIRPASAKDKITTITSDGQITSDGSIAASSRESGEISSLPPVQKY